MYVQTQNQVILFTAGCHGYRYSKYVDLQVCMLTESFTMIIDPDLSLDAEMHILFYMYPDDQVYVKSG